MAKKNQDEGFVDVGEVYGKTEDFVNRNGKMFAMIVIGVILLLVGAYLYKKVIVGPKNEKAQTKIWRAEYYFRTDSFNLALNGNLEYYGFKDIIKDYGATPSGNLARYYAGISSMKLGLFDEAIGYLSDCSFDDNIIMESLRLGTIGDAYIETGNIPKGVDYFNQSISSAANTATTPIYLKKLGLALESQGNTAEALATYKRLKKDYATSTEASNIDKYIGLLE